MISIAVTSYNRYLETVESFYSVLDIVDEVVISDDCSTDDSFIKLQAMFGGIDKVKIFRNDHNLGCYFNKRRAIELCTNDWVVILDSDNILSESYIQTLHKLPVWNPEVIYQPSWARPVFDFRAYQGEIINKENIKEFIDKPMVSTLFNAFNFFINRAEYLKVFDPSIEPWTSDSEYFALKWLQAGNSYCIVPGLEYDHLIHDGSHYKTFHKMTGDLHERIQEQLRQL